MAQLLPDAASVRAAPQLPRGKAERRLLPCEEALEIGFDVESSGLIIVVAATGAWEVQGQLLPRPQDGDCFPHKLELIPPGAAAREEITSRGESHIVYEPPPEGLARGRWTARLTNLATNPQEFGLFVSYPGTRELRVADLAADAFADLARLRLELRRGHDASSLAIETSADPVTHFFTVPDMEYSCPWIPRVLVYFDLLRSTTVTVSIPRDTPDPVLRYELAFDDEGVEIAGTIPLDLQQMRLTLDLPVVVQDYQADRSRGLSSVDYEAADIRAHFAFEPRFDGLVEWFPGFFPRWRRLIQRTVERASRELFAAPEVKKMLAEAMQERVLEQIGANARPVGVAPGDGRLRVSYYNVL